MPDACIEELGSSSTVSCAIYPSMSSGTRKHKPKGYIPTKSSIRNEQKRAQTIFSRQNSTRSSVQ
ncbi:hypothetical protein TorRG33x02_170460 [Trema orientale]|uniref:Uncharacterized protein n=1 Tax=Trema orientale TaxID=63057 RepID=A0A2P5ENG9_TREOI|nr:hypothetical protein TorRG33x02_170460 [Trema orientale]